MPHESVKQGSTVVQSVIFVKTFLLILKLLEIILINVLVKIIFRLLPCWVYLKINLSQNVIMGNMGNIASLQISCGFVSHKSVLELLRAVKVETLDFSLGVRSCLLESRKLLIVFPLRDSVVKLK